MLSAGEILQAGLWIIAIGTGSLLLAIYLLQDKLLYFPGMPPDAKTVFIPPSQFGLRHALHEIFITTPDNFKLQAYFVKHQHSKEVPTILYFHGNAGNLSYRLPNIKHLHGSDVGCNIFILSYRGYGKSEGTPTEQGLQIDAQTALDYLLGNPDIDTNKIVAFGRSLGGAVATKLTADNEDKIAALMIENTFTSIPDMIDVVMPWLRYFKSLCTNKWNTKEYISKVTVPVLLLSGLKDELVPSHMMKELYNLAEDAASRQLSEFADGHHMDTFTQPGYYDVVRNWLQKVFEGEKASTKKEEKEPTEDAED